MRLIFFLLFMLIPMVSSGANSNITIQIIGLSKPETETVLSNLSLKKIEKEKNLSTARILSLYSLAPKEISTTLQSLGYYHAKVNAELYSKQGAYHAVFHISRGAPVIIQQVDIQLLGPGKDMEELTNLVRNSTIRVGAQLNHGTYETFKADLLSKALQLGYLDAFYESNEIRCDIDQNRADIVLLLDTGTRYHFGAIHFSSPPYPSEFLKRFVPFSEGTPYTTEQLLSFQKALSDSDLFSKVRIDPQLNDTESFTVPLKVRLQKRPRNKYVASVGFGTDTNFRGRLGWEHRRANHPGHRINISGRTSKRMNQINLQYTIPGKHPTTDRIAFGSQMTQLLPSDKKYSLSTKTGVTHLQKRGKLEQILGFHYLSEIDRVLPTDPKRQTHFLMPSVGYTWSTIQKQTLLKEGVRVMLNARGALQPVLSSANLLQGEARLKSILPFGEKNRLITRLDVGATSFSRLKKIPLSLRYFTGGDHTVRGYGYQSLGPQERDANGNLIVVGGRYLFVASLEADRKIYKNIAAAVFVDTGNAMNHWRARLATGAGVGIRYETPLGPLRLDLAYPTVNGKPWPTSRAWHRPRVHLNFGMDL